VTKPKDLFELTHDDVEAETLLESYRLSAAQPPDSEVAAILGRAANLISRFYFIVEHTKYILQAKYHYEPDPAHRFFPIEDYTAECMTELFHSLIMAHEGLFLQAIHALRRCLETVVYGSFFSLSQLKTKNEKEINPFMLMEGTGIWPKSAGRKVIRLRDLRRVKKSERSGRTSEDPDLNEILDGFTRYYILNFTVAKCHRHTSETQDVCIAEIDSEFGLKCVDCEEPAKSIAFNRVPTFNLMLSVVGRRLGMSNRLAEIVGLYDELSNYVHPNPKGHQHRPSFEASNARMWLRLFLSTINTGLWIYSKTLTAIDFYDEELARFVEYNDHRLSITSMSSLCRMYCGMLMQCEKAS
jgi:hypothetical protein